jgi:hypothetical protein
MRTLPNLWPIRRPGRELHLTLATPASQLVTLLLVHAARLFWNSDPASRSAGGAAALLKIMSAHSCIRPGYLTGSAAMMAAHSRFATR